MNPYISARWLLPLALVAGATTAACGADTTTPGSPANPPFEARIYPPTNVPEVRFGPTAADLSEGRLVQHEEKLRRAGGLPGMP